MIKNSIMNRNSMRNRILKMFRSLFLLSVICSGSLANAQEDMLCRGAHWTEDEANLMMKEFASQWKDL